jgi:hypothetical protein
VVLGIREISRPLQFQSSYTLVVHAPWDSFQLEIMPKALAEAERLRAAVNKRRWDQIIEILGGSIGQTDERTAALLLAFDMALLKLIRGPQSLRAC